jgi:hypothetical protein
VITAGVFDPLYHAIRWTWHDPDGYNIVSGPVADITLLGGAYAIARRHNCHVKGCWRIARQQVPGTSYIVCRKHHPHDEPTAAKILEAHDQAMKDREAARATVGDGPTAAGNLTEP